jgi:hypothetical protein
MLEILPAIPAPEHCCTSRRHFLGTSAWSLGSLGLAWLLGQESASALPPPEKPELEPLHFDTRPQRPHHAPRAKAMISIFMGGGPSHLDLFDPKPTLEKYDGKIFPGGDIKYDNAGGASKIVMASPFKFAKRGGSGMEISELLPHTAEIADELTLIRSMNLQGIRNHVAGMRAMTTARGPVGRPSMGSWITYGLGSESENLPAYVALVIRKDPPGSPFWSSGLLPSVYQGTHVREEEPRIMNLDPPAILKGEPQQQQLALLDRINQRHLATHASNSDLAARIASYELAARMQLSAREALDVSRESRTTQDLYGLNDNTTRRHAEAFLIARRLVERGVRFVQIWDYGWDMHENINEVLPQKCLTADKPTAGLIQDLKSRGMLDTTLVHWGGEMGRLPVIQGRAGKPGRDHNTDGFSIWMAGGGVKRGYVHGATDDFGLFAVENVVHHTDFLTTVLHLMGLDVAQLIYKRNGRSETILDNQDGKVIGEILA